jgi:hypothetical protein
MWSPMDDDELWFRFSFDKPEFLGNTQGSMSPECYRAWTDWRADLAERTRREMDRLDSKIVDLERRRADSLAAHQHQVEQAAEQRRQFEQRRAARIAELENQIAELEKPRPEASQFQTPESPAAYLFRTGKLKENT